MLLELVVNAIRFTAQGAVRVAGTPSVDEPTAWVEFSVIDTGPGIAPEVQQFMFEMFRQGDSTTIRRHAGVGMGLTICRALVELLGGSIVVESVLGQGSTVRVRLPRTRRTVPSGTATTESTEEEAENRGTGEPENRGIGESGNRGTGE